MSEVLEATTPGWRPDPSGRYEWRYWDGGWTNRVANSARPAPTLRSCAGGRYRGAGVRRGGPARAGRAPARSR